MTPKEKVPSMSIGTLRLLLENWLLDEGSDNYLIHAAANSLLEKYFVIDNIFWHFADILSIADHCFPAINF